MKRNLFFTLLIGILLCSSCQKQPASLQEVPSQFVVGTTGKIHYKTYGEQSPTIVFIHGFGCDINAWNEQFPYFAGKNRMVFIDLPGYGKSDKPETAEYSLDTHADAVKTVLDTLNIQQAVLVGHSLGTPICRRTVQKYPQLAVKLCDVDGVYCFYPTDSAEYTAYKSQIEGFVGMFKDEKQFKENIAGFVGSLFVPTTPQAVKDYATQTMTQTLQPVANSTMSRLVDEKYWDKSVISIPTLVFCSTNSQIPANYKSIMQSLYSDMKYEEWDSVGHFMMMEDPARFNAILEEFLK